MGNPTFDLNARRLVTVQQDWLASLPEEKSRLFASVYEELEVSYIILSVTLDDAFRLCDQGKLGTAREQASMFSDLFKRLTGRLRGVLRTLEEHGRHFGTQSRVEPLCSGTFRSRCAQRMARVNRLRSVLTPNQSRECFRKLAALDQVIVMLQAQVRATVAEIREGAALWPKRDWALLEVLHYDLNTCFCETSIVLKSFLCALPDKELLAFSKRLRFLVPLGTTTVHSRRQTRFATKMGSACTPELATPHPAPTSADYPGDPSPGKQPHSRR